VTVDEIRLALRDAGLERLASQVEQLVLPAIRIDVQPVDEDELPVGTSKIGGRPDLPPDIAWPEHEGRPLGFLAQFNLTEVAPYNVEYTLPSSGMLYFFYDLQSEPYGITPEQRTAWRVLTIGCESSHPQRMCFPHDLPDKCALRSYTVRLLSSTTLGAYSSLLQQFEPIGREDWIAYWPVWDATANQSQLLGYPRGIVSDTMPLACHLYATGHSYREVFALTEMVYGEMDEQIRRRAAQAARDWRLLFQLGDFAGESIGIRELEGQALEEAWRSRHNIWGRDGTMYFWIEKDHLARRDFSNVWLQAETEF